MPKTNVSEIDRQSLAELIDRIEQAIEHDLSLSVADMKLLLSAITTLCTLQAKMEQDDITLHKLRKLLGMVKQSERRGKPNQDKPSSRGNSKKSSRPRNRKPSAPPKIVHHTMQDYHKGDLCPGCGHGKLYKFDPGKLLRITGHARFEAIHHVVEQLRCNGCQVVYKANLPESVLADGDANQQYGYSARAIMAIDKFYTGTPYYHQSNLSEMFGCTISASTIYDQCENVSNSGIAIYYQMQRQAANAYRFSLDDTHNRILGQQPELRDNRNGTGKRLRTGVYTSGLIATCEDGHEIILFQTSLGHAGEHLDDILQKRDPSLPPPLTMSDALSSNLTTQALVRSCYCNAHSRRQFVDLELLYPDKISWVLDQYGLIWEHEAKIQEQGFDDEQRLGYHAEHSLPIMRGIQDWAEQCRLSSTFEEHSALGKAIKYFLKHYEKLIMFCVEAGALIDNNRMEEKLKIAIRGRKTSHFYKTAIGADVANVLMSLIATTDQAQENVFDYFQAFQRHAADVKLNPAAWLPWNYRDTLAKISKKQAELEPG